MMPSERPGLVDHADPVLPVVAQCQLLKVARSTLYYRPVPADPDDLAVMRRIDELHLAYPFHGSRRMAVVLRDDGWVVNRKRAQRLMRLMGLEAIYSHSRTLAPQDRDRLFQQTCRTAIETMIKGFDPNETVDDGFPGHRVDMETQWHTHHVNRTGEVGRWRHTLDPAQAMEVQRRLGPWMERFGYQS